MGLRIGIVGLPNVGKSTTFNALTRAQNAEVAAYPFCTIEPNRAVVPVPDERLEKLQRVTGRPNIIYATITFVDIAGLVEGASRGEGLGNKFLANIRDTDLILHLVRCFEDPNVPHIRSTMEPARDMEIIETELILADLEQLDRKIERLTGQAKGDRSYLPLLEMAAQMRDHLDSSQPLRAFQKKQEPSYLELTKELSSLTAKPVLLVINVDEKDLVDPGRCVEQARRKAQDMEADTVLLSAKLEEALIDLSPSEREELLEFTEDEHIGLNAVIRKSYDILDLISFFTMNEEEVRAWTVERGQKAPEAAGVIHSDFQRGFIKAEVVSYEAFAAHGSFSAARTAGALRVEGKDYEVQDGDVIYFRFNV